MLRLNWFQFYLPLIVPDCGNEYMTKENNEKLIEPVLKILPQD